jgi:hypothetical protein
VRSGNVPFSLIPETTAARVFADRCVDLTDMQALRHRIDHLECLNKAKDRIARAISKVKGL